MHDEEFIRRALELAERGRGLTSPNPMVGAVVVFGDRIVGEGFHAGAGKPHAEVQALGVASDAARGATLYCSLEPCDHFGRTPPCTDAIIESGIARVVAAVRDPNPAAGSGLEKLRDSGVATTDGVLAEDSERLNEAFFKHVRTGLPFVTLKLAATLDGKIAARDGSSTWITSEESRAEVHRMRGAADAIVVGAGTVVADDPHLTVRDPGYLGAPVLRVALDGSGRISLTANLFDGEAPTLVATTEEVPVDRREAWRAAGAEVLICGTDIDGNVSIGDMLRDLGKRGVQSVLLEGGSTLADSSVRQGFVDKFVLFLAPKVLGGADAKGILGGEGFPTLADAQDLEITEARRVGPDLKVEAYVHRDR